VSEFCLLSSFWGVFLRQSYSVGFVFCRSLDHNELFGSIPAFLSSFKLRDLYLANNMLCYSVAYNAWATESDFVPSTASQNCISPCQNGGTWTAVGEKRVCKCPPNWFGKICSLPNLWQFFGWLISPLMYAWRFFEGLLFEWLLTPFSNVWHFFPWLLSELQD